MPYEFRRHDGAEFASHLAADGFADGTGDIGGHDSAEGARSVYEMQYRVVGTTVKPNTETTLVTSRTYVNNQLFQTEDPYGRKTFYAYSASTGRLIRTIRAAVPSVDYADFAAVLNAERAADSVANPTSLITDYIYDPEGQTLQTIDPRGLVHVTEYDSRGRQTVRVQSAMWANEDPTSVSARTETFYDDHGNVVEVRPPRWFDSNDTGGYQKSRTTMTYTGRNLLKTRTEAPGTAQAATTRAFGAVFTDVDGVAVL